METLSHDEVVVLLTSISIMLLASRFFAELGRKFKLPIVMGEMILGILLGPSLIGELFPSFFNTFFPASGNVAISINAISQLSVIMLLFVAGMEVQLPVVLKQGRLALYTSLTSLAIPFTIGFWLAWINPELFQIQQKQTQLIFAIFFGTAMAISALPVIARILMDMNIYRTKLGMLIMASAMFNDLIGWLIFSVVLAMMDHNGSGVGLGLTLFYVIAFGIIMLTVGRKLLSRTLPFIQSKLSWPGGVLAFSLGLCFLCAAFTQAAGVHAILGAFIMGIALGDSVHLNEKAREIIHQFVTNVFAPLFFVSIGLHVNFITHFNLQLVTIVLLIACVGKISGASLGAYMGGLDFKNSMAVGFGMNARGAMEILLGTIAFKAEIIGVELYVALLVMALVTSITTPPLMKLMMRKDES
jgi:Kef-type K+ transport system membrane component KefB